MPELPDITVYLEALDRLIMGHRLERVRLVSPFVLRTTDPPLKEADGKSLRTLRRIGKQIVFELEGSLYIIAPDDCGRFHWRGPGAKIPGKVGLAAFDFSHGTLLLTEAGTKKRAALHVVRTEDALRHFDSGGIEPLSSVRTIL